MTQYIAWISLDNRALACGELELLLDARIITPTPKETAHELSDNHVIFFDAEEKSESLFSRLAYTKLIAKVLDSSLMETVERAKERFDFADADKTIKSYRVDFLNSMHDISELTAKHIFSTVFRSIDKPKISLKTPEAIFCTFIDEKKTLWVARQIWHNDYKYEQRKSHLRQRRHPAAMPPKLIRAMINLTGLRGKTGEIVCDPFCGTAGILIEAMHCGFHVVGSDIELKMTNGAKINIKNEIAAAPELAKLCDPQTDIARESALIMMKKSDAIVTDVPYGKNTKKLKNPDLYRDFLNHVERNKLAKRIVICMPHFADGKAIIQQTKWNILASFALRVHNGLTREVFVIDITQY